MQLFKKLLGDDDSEIAECIHMHEPDKSQLLEKDELPMKPGNKIVVLKKDKGEWYGKNGKEKGWFPANRVRIIK